MANPNKICSYCRHEKLTVNRHMFDGMCADCTDKALYSHEVAKKAEVNNKKLLEIYRGY